mmetsp:Transcript_10959/g.16579  ORF Transcript_10959/g.16579 Transcript_10959/m.16579 type:complete len:88 (-) Transcript_10959:8-271(-)
MNAASCGRGGHLPPVGGAIFFRNGGASFRSFQLRWLSSFLGGGAAFDVPRRETAAGRTRHRLDVVVTIRRIISVSIDRKTGPAYNFV